LLIDLDGDAREEAVVLAALGGVVWVYAQRPAGWTLVGRLMAERSLEGPEALLKALAERRWRTVPPAYLGLEIGTMRYTFQPEPCETGEAGCP
jgi:hypothetical protein